jgi:hypothetical protein
MDSTRKGLSCQTDKKTGNYIGFAKTVSSTCKKKEWIQAEIFLQMKKTR